MALLELRPPVRPPDQGIRPAHKAPLDARHSFTLRRLSRQDRLVMAALFIMAVVFSLWNLTGAPSYQDDEGTYTAQAFSVHKGTLAPYTYWYDHPPLGWIQIAALNWIPMLFNLGDGTAIGATRYVIAAFFVSSAILLYMLARRLTVRIPFAALTTVVFILSPLSLVLGRQVYLDNVAVPWVLLAFYLALSSRHALAHHVFAGTCFAIAVLSKETLAIFGPALLLTLINRPRWSNRAFSVVGFLAVGALVLAFYPLAALLRNELLAGPDHVSLQEALTFQFLKRSGSGTIFETGSSRAELLTGWLYFDKYLITAGLIAALVCLFRRNSRAITLAVALFALPIVLGQGYLPAMYIIAVIPFLALAVGVGVDIAWSGTEKLWRHHAGLKNPLRGSFVVALGGSLVLMSMPQWFEQDRELLTAETNTDWKNTMTWVQDNVSREDVVLAPYSMWHDLNSSGWDDPWSMIAVEKPDLDAQFDQIHPGSWRDVDYIVVGPTVLANIENLGLTRTGKVLENSVPVKTFGEWSINKMTVPLEELAVRGTP
ncbi:phospholipid carrier-dependent glycosyltransferase [Arthrobacter cheniae]|uniref:Phospholipid carrier-dependent glycosyltransferase n=2 Tax=Arthrobacter cheniae TaxID=1258888 RepID=A0A3A5M6N0_9MICC|nr:phospholipid carrier-dependent glycosyltransferase [Arthrobacter cheniae]